MQPSTGQTFDLSNYDQVLAGLRSVEATGEPLVQVEQEEVERLKKMSRQDRRAELRKRPKLEREELKKLMAEIQNSRSKGPK